MSAADDDRLVQESLDAGELLPAGEGLYYSRSYFKDTARAEERTIVATSNEADKGIYNNWKPSADPVTCSSAYPLQATAKTSCWPPSTPGRPG